MTALLLLATAKLTFLDNHFAQQWFAVRSGTTVEGYGPAVELARTAGKDRSQMLAMGALDGIASVSPGPSEFRAAIKGSAQRPGFEDAVALATKIADEIEKLGRKGRERLVAAEKPALDRTKARLNDSASVEGAIDLAAKDIGFSQQDPPILVLLVPDAPAPGAATYRTIEGPVCVIGVASFKGDEVVEAVVHEAMHALDERHKDEDSALNRLRKALTSKGVATTDPRYREAPHAVIFATAAYRAKQDIGKGYVPFGVSHGAYERMGEATRAAIEIWERRLGGTQTTDQAIERIVERVTSG
ncbi:MAG: hypothetical protein WD716_00520 [Fimbriimonadaceae bacterium]